VEALEEAGLRTSSRKCYGVVAGDSRSQLSELREEGQNVTHNNNPPNIKHLQDNRNVVIDDDANC
jgi:hypothetical protein